MQDKKHITIDFPDEKDVEIRSFRVSNTYEGSMEGSFHSVAVHILHRLLKQSKEDGFLFQLTSDQIETCEQKPFQIIDDDPLKPNEILKSYRFELSLRDKSNDSHLTIVWFDDAPSLETSLQEIIGKHIKSINYHDFARVIDWDDF